MELMECLINLLLPKAQVERVGWGDLLERDPDLRFRLIEELERTVVRVADVGKTLRTGYLRDEVYPRAIVRGVRMINYLLLNSTEVKG